MVNLPKKATLEGYLFPSKLISKFFFKFKNVQ